MEIFIFILVLIIVVLLIYTLMQYNKLIKKKLKVEQAKSGIDVYLKQRFDLIPNILECVKGYTKYEKETLKEITNLRTQYNNSKDLKTGEKLNSKVNNLLAIAENYPELKSNEQFTILQNSLIKIESQLQAARRLYNADVTNLNTSISTFPSNIIANLFNFKKEELFELEEENEKNNINIKL